MPAWGLNGTVPGFSIQRTAHPRCPMAKIPGNRFVAVALILCFMAARNAIALIEPLQGVGPRSLLLRPQLGPGEDHGIFGAVHAPL